MKQTLEAPYDPGALLLNGPHVRFTSFDQLLSRNEKGLLVDRFSAGFTVSDGRRLRITFDRLTEGGFDVAETVYDNIQKPTWRSLSRGMSQVKFPGLSKKESAHAELKRMRCFLDILRLPGGEFELDEIRQARETHLINMIHVPALRRNPERAYGATAVGNSFPGPFEPYVASIIHRWQGTQDERLNTLNSFLQTLGLTTSVRAQRLNDTQIELSVGRLKKGITKKSATDMISIADVGFGISQIMPLLVALLTAREGQLVYIEQPEIHLHPNAQVALATVLAHAANRGVRVVAETHSALLLLGIQTLVAEQKLSPKDVVLHWFERMEDGMSRVTSAELDESGAFGDWPEDFDDVTLKAQAKYMDAAENRLLSGKS